MVNRRRLGLAVTAALAASVTFAGASALAASGSAVTHETNYRGQARPRHPVAVAARPRTNYRAHVRTQAGAAPAEAAGTVTHHFALAASAFAADGLHHATQDYLNGLNPASLSNTDSARCFNAALSLPNGITLKSVTIYYTAGSDAMFFAFSRQDLLNHMATDLVAFDTPGATTPAYTSMTKPIPAADAAINYSKYGYTVGVCPDGNTTFSGLIITYTQPAS